MDFNTLIHNVTRNKLLAETYITGQGYQNNGFNTNSKRKLLQRPKML